MKQIMARSRNVLREQGFRPVNKNLGDGYQPQYRFFGHRCRIWTWGDQPLITQEKLESVCPKETWKALMLRKTYALVEEWLSAVAMGEDLNGNKLPENVVPFERPDDDDDDDA
jgi:hypothetical protein